MTKQINIRLPDNLYYAVKHKCHEKFGIGISPLIKFFLKAFVTQKSIGFWVGDTDLDKLFRDWVRGKHIEKIRGKRNCMLASSAPFKKLFEL